MKASAREICPSQSSTDEIKSLLAVSPDVSLMSDSESIEDLLMDLKDISTSESPMMSTKTAQPRWHLFHMDWRNDTMKRLINEPSWHETTKHVNYVESYVLKAC